MTRLRIPLLATLILLAAVCGCGGDGRASARGQVKFPDGSPVTKLEGGQVVFETTGPDGKPSTATGTIDDQGRFELGTERPGDGAVVGKSKVLVTPPTATGDVPLPLVIAKKYESFETSGIEVEVKPGSNDLTITVEPAGKR